MRIHLTLVLVAVLSWGLLGWLSYGITNKHLVNACLPTVNFSEHVALWPISWAAAMDATSNC